jgi:hypothetical protein
MLRFFRMRRGFRVRLLAPRMLMMAARFIPAWSAGRLWRRRLMTWRLDAAQGAAQLIDFPLVGQLLALGKLHEFKDFVQLVDRVFE